MSTSVPSLPLHLGQLVRRRTDPADSIVGFVAGLLFLDHTLALVRWPGAGSSFEPEEGLVDVGRPRL